MWNYDFENVSNLIDVHIFGLRRRIDAYPIKLLHTCVAWATGWVSKHVAHRDPCQLPACAFRARAQYSWAHQHPLIIAARGAYAQADLQAPAYFRSIRWRLTGWYVCLLGGVLFLFSAGTYVAVYRLLVQNFDGVLASQATLIVKTIDITDSQLRFDNNALRIGRINDEHVVRIYDADGELIYNDNSESAPKRRPCLVRSAGRASTPRSRGTRGRCGC
ncbi:MAG: hypothetical protein U0Z44_17485 [Kouleothrix sp.]